MSNLATVDPKQQAERLWSQGVPPDQIRSMVNVPDAVLDTWMAEWDGGAMKVEIFNAFAEQAPKWLPICWRAVVALTERCDSPKLATGDLNRMVRAIDTLTGSMCRVVDRCVPKAVMQERGSQSVVLQLGQGIGARLSPSEYEAMHAGDDDEIEGEEEGGGRMSARAQLERKVQERMALVGDAAHKKQLIEDLGYEIPMSAGEVAREQE